MTEPGSSSQLLCTVNCSLCWPKSTSGLYSPNAIVFSSYPSLLVSQNVLESICFLKSHCSKPRQESTQLFISQSYQRLRVCLQERRREKDLEDSNDQKESLFSSSKALWWPQGHTDTLLHLPMNCLGENSVKQQECKELRIYPKDTEHNITSAVLLSKWCNG